MQLAWDSIIKHCIIDAPLNSYLILHVLVGEKINVTYMVFMLLSTPKEGLLLASNEPDFLWDAGK
jgi:hypothetical protein